MFAIAEREPASSAGQQFKQDHRANRNGCQPATQAQRRGVAANTYAWWPCVPVGIACVIIVIKPGYCIILHRIVSVECSVMSCGDIVCDSDIISLLSILYQCF